MGCLTRLGAALDQPTDPVELPVVEQPLPVEEQPVLAAPAAEAGGRWSSIRSSAMNRLRKGKGSVKKGLQKVKRVVRSVPQVVDRTVTKVQDAFSHLWECAVCVGECICNTVSRVVGSLLGSSPAPEPAAEPTPVTLAETGAEAAEYADGADASDLSGALVPTSPVLSMLPVSADVSAPVGPGYDGGAPSVPTSPFPSFPADADTLAAVPADAGVPVDAVGGLRPVADVVVVTVNPIPLLPSPVPSVASALVGSGYSGTGGASTSAAGVVITFSPFSLEERLLASSDAHALVGASYGGAPSVPTSLPALPAPSLPARAAPTAVISTGGAGLLTDVGDSIPRSWLEFFTLLDVVAAACGCDPSTIDLSNKPRMYIASASDDGGFYEGCRVCSRDHVTCYPGRGETRLVVPFTQLSDPCACTNCGCRSHFYPRGIPMTTHGRYLYYLAASPCHVQTDGSYHMGDQCDPSCEYRADEGFLAHLAAGHAGLLMVNCR